MNEQDLQKLIAEDLKYVLEQGRIIGCKEVKCFRNIPMSNVAVVVDALNTRIKLKEYIERINQPEYNDIVWKKDEVVLLLQELVAG